ncbi:MAG: flagellar hook-length control protein FliK [Oceanococcaceae bacterium]
MAANLGASTAPATATGVRASSVSDAHRAPDGEHRDLDFAAMVRGGLPAVDSASPSAPPSRPAAGTVEATARAQRIHAAAAVSTSAAAGEGTHHPRGTDATDIATDGATAATTIADVDPTDADLAAEAPATATTGDAMALPSAELHPEQEMPLSEITDAEAAAALGVRPDVAADAGSDAGPDIETDAHSAPVHAPVGAAPIPLASAPMASTVESTSASASTDDHARAGAALESAATLKSRPAGQGRGVPVSELAAASDRPIGSTVSPLSDSSPPFAVVAEAAVLPPMVTGQPDDPVLLHMPSVSRSAVTAASAPSPADAATAATSAAIAAPAAGRDFLAPPTGVPTMPADGVAEMITRDELRPLSGLLESMEDPASLLRLEAPAAVGRSASLAMPISLAGGPLPTIAVAVDGADGQWLQGMAQDIVQLQEAGETRLRINLAPAHLGSLQVELQQTDLGMELRVLADSAAARDLLQSHGADLRQRFAEAGMHLAQFHCGTGGQPQGSAHSGSAAGQASATGDRVGDDIPTPPLLRPLTALRLLDLYA